MRTIPLVLLIAAMGLAGCIGGGETIEPSESAEAAGASNLPDPVEATWDGYILSSATGPLAHHPVTEPMVSDVQREGFVFEIQEVPMDLTAALEWQPSGPGAEILIMVSSPREDGSGYEYFTEMSAEPQHCLRVPVEDLEPGHWQVMAHSNNAVDVDIHFTVTTIGGQGGIVEGMPHSEAEAENVEEREALSCDEGGV